MSDVYTPAKAAYRGSTAPLNPERCKAQVWSRDRWSHTSQCSRKHVKDGWCKTHHPDAEAERKTASDERFKAHMRKQAMGWYGERMMSALIKIREGDNDPRQTARDALSGIEYAEEPTQ